MGLAIKQGIIAANETRLLAALHPLRAHYGASARHEHGHYSAAQQLARLSFPVLFDHWLRFLLRWEGITLLLACRGSLFSPF
ncbi:hypothetical protein AA15973_0818 [Komagataeibacter sucrofermentans DSM 15973]|nr:hypothetical protein AA15973_0818 [Komagataeibacter sucrofermentans DSM 15973]